MPTPLRRARRVECRRVFVLNKKPTSDRAAAQFVSGGYSFPLPFPSLASCSFRHPKGSQLDFRKEIRYRLTCLNLRGSAKSLWNQFDINESNPPPTMEKETSPQATSQEADLPSKAPESDDGGLINASGHRQELDRNFKLINIVGLGLTSGVTWIPIGGSIVWRIPFSCLV